MKTIKKANLVQRTVTGLILVAAIIACILLSPWAFGGLFAFLIFAVLMEFYTLINVTREVRIHRWLHSAMGAVLFLSVFLNTSHVIHSKTYLSGGNIFLIYMVYVMTMFITRLYSKQENPIRELAYIILGQVYIAAPLSMLNAIAFHMLKYPDDMNIIGNYCPIFLLALFFFIWINDTGAYLTGMSCGKHKLFERISPKKTWEGFFGGLVACVLLGLLLGDYEFWDFFGIHLTEAVRLSRLEWTLLGVVVSIFSTFGDLIESLVKRSVGVKDSGKMLPGHGGFWDRFDSLIMAAPGMYLFLVIISALHI